MDETEAAHGLKPRRGTIEVARTLQARAMGSDSLWTRGHVNNRRAAMAVREYYVEVSFTEDLSAEVKAELAGGFRTTM
jgi:hypothetical protein